MNKTCSITKTLANRAIEWYGHVHRMNESRWAQIILERQPVGKERDERQH